MKKSYLTVLLTLSIIFNCGDSGQFDFNSGENEGPLYQFQELPPPFNIELPGSLVYEPELGSLKSSSAGRFSSYGCENEQSNSNFSDYSALRETTFQLCEMNSLSFTNKWTLMLLDHVIIAVREKCGLDAS